MARSVKGSTPICSVDGCEKLGRHRGLCSMHDTRLRRHGSVHARTRAANGEPLAYLKDAVANRDRSTGCWEWPFALSAGYGVFGGPQGKTYAHVQALILDGQPKPPPPGNHVLHACDNRRCFNPACLSWGTNAENVADMVSKGRHIQGERNHQAKLTAAQVNAIRKDSRSDRAIALEFSVSPYTVKAIRTGQRWTHLLGKDTA